MPMTGLRLTLDGRTAVYARGSETNAQGERLTGRAARSNPNNKCGRPMSRTASRGCSARCTAPPRAARTSRSLPMGNTRHASGQHQLWLAPISPDTRTAARLIPGDVSQPRWSPDGKEIAFVSDRGSHALIGVFRLAATVATSTPAISRHVAALVRRWLQAGFHPGDGQCRPVPFQPAATVDDRGVGCSQRQHESSLAEAPMMERIVSERRRLGG